MPPASPFFLFAATYGKALSPDMGAFALIPRSCQHCVRTTSDLAPRRDEWLCRACRVSRELTSAEIADRARRANALADVLTAAGGDLAALASMTEAHWNRAALAARVSTPSLETRCFTATVLYQRAIRKAAANV